MRNPWIKLAVLSLAGIIVSCAVLWGIGIFDNSYAYGNNNRNGYNMQMNGYNTPMNGNMQMNGNWNMPQGGNTPMNGNWNMQGGMGNMPQGGNMPSGGGMGMMMPGM